MGARRIMLDWLANHPEVTFSQVVELVEADAGVSRAVARNRVGVTLSKLVEQGKIERIALGVYRLVPQGAA